MVQAINVIFLTLLFGLPIFANFAIASAQQYDLVINNGRVMDPETRYDGIANVGIKNGRITAITKSKITGKQSIDAKGLVVAAGFNDTHFHWTRPLGYKLALREGVTTAMDLEAGVYGPLLGDWYNMHEGKSQVNYALPRAMNLPVPP
jgi:predicted amidohydrolase